MEAVLVVGDENTRSGLRQVVKILLLIQLLFTGYFIKEVVVALIGGGIGCGATFIINKNMITFRLSWKG